MMMMPRVFIRTRDLINCKTEDAVLSCACVCVCVCVLWVHFRSSQFATRLFDAGNVTFYGVFRVGNFHVGLHTAVHL